MKSLKVSEETHRLYKLRAVAAGVTIDEIARRLIQRK